MKKTVSPFSSHIACLLLMGSMTACVSGPSGKRPDNNAFISYKPSTAEKPGLRLAVKDLIDMKGEVTSAGSEYLAKHSPPASRDAECMAIARERNVNIVGKTNLTEFAITVSGRNGYFGTPENKLDGRHLFIPGGSSSGSAVAVSSGLADVAFGTDTGGSIRVPAACCGIYGLKTTYGLVSTKGVFPISAKHLDTVGPMAANLPNLVQGMDLLQRGFKGRYDAAAATHPSAGQIRIGRLYIPGTDPAIDRAIDDRLRAKGFKIVKLDARFADKWAQADADGEVIATSDAWKNDRKYTDNLQIDSNTRTVLLKGSIDNVVAYDAAVRRKAAWKRELARVFRKVDFIATPTMQILPPRKPFWRTSSIFELYVLNSQNTMAVNFAGNPALAMPVGMPESTIPTSLQLVGPPRSEAALLNAGRLLQTNN
ncbi:amidase [Luteolibacter yonseiensis]|uniref:Amidase n=1 Tax=Luteolibacter yonseiensis TaxID=1144680 RepID=A0A934R894_9BACT|nr:amidase [Luteolibacter yonseiensis]MBK1817996.1 amidase [Luteolibacter yonseiensis]